MKLIRRDPFTEWLPLRTFLRDFPDRFQWTEALVLGEDDLHVDEYTENRTLVIKAEMPGIDPDKDVELTVEDGWLTIRAQREQESEKKDRKYYRREMRYGMFARSLPLPETAEENDIKATYTDGILEVHVPLGEEHDAESETKTQIPIG